MVRPDRNFDWRSVFARDARSATVVDSRRRIAWLLAGFGLALTLVLARATQLEVTQGPTFRRLARIQRTRSVEIPATRGRLQARDGTVLAADRPSVALAVHYRFLQREPDARWLRYQAIRRLSKTERRDGQRVREAIDRVRVELADMHRRLAARCGVSTEAWNQRRARVERRIERIADGVNQRHAARLAESAAQPASTPSGFWERVGSWAEQLLSPGDRPASAATLVVAEQLDYHVLFEGLDDEDVREIRLDPENYPGVRIVHRSRREYPSSDSAAHVVGYLGKPAQADAPPDQLVGQQGLERYLEQLLRGERGVERQRLDRRGQILARETIQEPASGRDVRLTLDVRLQRAAEALLDHALLQRDQAGTETSAAGGAVVLMDCHNGELLALASAPRFDPNLFLDSRSERLAELLTASDKPLFDRATRMAIPPGSVMKVVTAAALLERGVVKPETSFYCQGFLNDPGQLRCAVYRRFGVGHDELTLADALAESCNVYFFYFAGRLGPGPLIEWSRRFGLGTPTGIDLPSEAAGNVPTPDQIQRRERHNWQKADTRALAVGQSRLTTTPLQIARAIAAIANDGLLVRPRIIKEPALPDEPASSDRLVGLRPATLAAIRAGMERAVYHADGTAHGSLSKTKVPVAAKTGTAQTGARRADHAWIAGYAPADAPQVVFVVALEHAGDGGSVAGPVARQLIQRLDQYGYLRAARLADESSSRRSGK